MKKIFTIFSALILLSICLSGCNQIDIKKISIQYFFCEPQIIERGEHTNLSWNVTFAQNVSINHDIGMVSEKGKINVYPDVTTTYILTASNSLKTITASITVIVTNKSTTTPYKIPNINFSKDQRSNTLTITDIGDSILWSEIQIFNGDKPKSSTYVLIGDKIRNCSDTVIITYQKTKILGVWSFSNAIVDKEIIGKGDFADIHYTAMFKSNGTVFDTTHESIAKRWGIYNNNKTYEPLRIYINPNGFFRNEILYEPSIDPIINKFINPIIGMKKGEKKLAIIFPEDAFDGWNESLAESYGLSPYPIESKVDIKWDMEQSLFTQYFTDVNLSIGTIFDWGFIMLGVKDTIYAKITQVTPTNITYIVEPENNLTFLIPLFNWTVRILLTNSDYFIMRTETYVGFETWMDLGNNQTLALIIIEMNNTDLNLALKQNEPQDDTKLIEEILVYEIEVINIYDTSRLSHI